MTKHYAPGKATGLVGRGDSHNIFEVSILRLGTECEAGWNLIADKVLLRASEWYRDIVGLESCLLPEVKKCCRMRWWSEFN